MIQSVLAGEFDIHRLIDTFISINADKLVRVCGYTPASRDERQEAQANWQCDNSVHPDPNQGLQEEPGSGGCPAGMARIRTGSSSLPDYCMDRFEASLVLVGENNQELNWSPFHNPGNRNVKAVSLRGAMAQQFISGDQARLACERAGKRLCTDDEWKRACQGPNGAYFPYTWPDNASDTATASNRYPPGTSKDNPPCHESVPVWAPGLYCHLKPAPKCRESQGGPTNTMSDPCVAQIPHNQAARTWDLTFK